MGFTGVEVIEVDDLDLMSATLKKDSPRRAAAGSVSLPRADILAASRRAAYTEQSAPGGAARPAAPGRAGATPEPGTAAAILRRVITVKGGLAALKRVQTVVADSQTTFRMGQGPLFSTTRTYVVYPDKFRVDAKISGSDVIQAYNSGSAWVKDPTGVHDASTAMRSDFAASVQRDIIPLLIAAAEGHAEIRLLADATVENVTFKVLEVTGPRLPPVRLFVNDQMLVVRQTYNTAGPDGRLVQADELFSDYQTIEGIRIPFKAVVLRGGQPILERTLTRVVINGSVDAQLFERPAQ
jgi:hypothetical protein